MVRLDLLNFDLKKICESGQIFRMYECSSGIFDVYSGERRLNVKQEKLCNVTETAGDCRDAGSLCFRTEFDCGEEEFYGYWFDYFDLGRDYSSLVSKAMEGDDEFLRNACSYGGDIRLLRQDTWEMMISFIISQQKQIPSIRKCIEALCERFGVKKDGYFAFPTAGAIAEAGPDGLKGLSLGYRERYIYETAVKYLECGIRDEVLADMTYREAKDYLLSFTGIGEKVANCILLFGAGFADAFPIDTHIKDILYREYYLPQIQDAAAVPDKEKISLAAYGDIIEEHFGGFRGSRGIVQQWIFAYELNKA